MLPTSTPSGYTTRVSLLYSRLVKAVTASKLVPFLWLPWSAIIKGAGLSFPYSAGICTLKRLYITVPSAAAWLLNVNDLDDPPGTRLEAPLFPQPSLGLEAENTVVQRREVARSGLRMEESMAKGEEVGLRHGYPELL
jgi:hypothetical protein